MFIPLICLRPCTTLGIIYTYVYYLYLYMCVCEERERQKQTGVMHDISLAYVENVTAKSFSIAL